MAEPIYRVSDNGLGELIAVGANGLILHSTDSGTTWNARYSGTTEHLYGAAYGDALGVTGWLVVGANGTILKSSNGNVWYPIANPITENIYDIAFGGIFVLVGANGLMASSDSFGTFWFFNESGTTEDLYNITIELGGYVIVGANDTVITGELLSLNFDIKVIEQVNISESKSSRLIAERAVSSGFEIVSPVGGVGAGQKVSFTLTGPVDAGDIFSVTLDGTEYTHTVGSHTHLKMGSSIVVGGTPVGSVNNIDTLNTTYYQIPETNGTPGFDVRFKFTSDEGEAVDLRFVGRYEGSAAHDVDIQAWNWDTQIWETVDSGNSFVHSATDQDLTLPLVPAGHIASASQLDPVGGTGTAGDVWVRFYHTSPGNVTHNLYIDMLRLIEYDVTLSDIIDGLAEAINDGGEFYAYNNGSALVVGRINPPTDFIYTAGMNNDPGLDNTISTGTLVQSSSNMQITATFGGTVETGDLFRITLNGTNYDYTTQAGDTTTDDIAAGWLSTHAAALGAAGFDATVSGNVVTITTQSPTAEFTYSSSTTNGGATDDQTVTLALVRSGALSGTQYYEYVSDEANVTHDVQQPLGVYNHVATETIDTLDTFIGNAGLQQAVSSGLVASDTIAFTFANGFVGELSLYPLTLSGELLVGNQIGGALSLPALEIAGRLVRELGGDLVLPMISVSGSLSQPLEITGELLLPRIRIAGQLIIQHDDTEYVVWVVNSDNKAHSTYTEFKANSFDVFNNLDIIATDEGIFELQDGADDNGTAIDSKITWVPTDYGVPSLKRLDSAYVNLRHAVGGLLKTTADETEERVYSVDMTAHAEGMHKKRVLLVRGIAGEFWQIGFESDDGRFTLGDVEITPVASKRRIK